MPSSTVLSGPILTNVGHYSNPEANKKIEELATETDPAKRNQLSKEIRNHGQRLRLFLLLSDFFKGRSGNGQVRLWYLESIRQTTT